MRINNIQPRTGGPPAWTPIGTLNVRGLAGNAEAVKELIRTHGLQLLALTETWLRPMDPVPLPYATESICLPPTGQRYRGQGGVTLVIQPETRYHLIEKIAENTHQLVAIRIGGTTIVALYLSPSLPKTRLLEILKHLQKITRGSAIILGDLNSRHPSWEVDLPTGHSNTQGNTLYAWTRQYGWEVRGTTAPTYESIHGRSTVDLFLVKGVPFKEPVVVYGPWDGMSDHHPVIGEVDLHISPELRTIKLPKACRNKDHLRTRAKEHYEQVFPNLAEKIETCTGKEQLEAAYDQIERAIVQPWNQNRHRRPKRFSEFWTTELDHMAKQRTRKYRKACATRKREDWAEYHNADRAIKRAARKRKRECFQKFTMQVDNGSAGEKAKTLGRILRIKDGRRKQNSLQGAPLDPAEFTRFTAAKCSPAGVENIPLLPFHLPPAFKDRIYRAIKNAPVGKATGKDDIFSEALAIAPEPATELLYKVWKKCGELQWLPRAWQAAELVPLHKKGNTWDPSNYRPISLLSHLRKIIETAIDKELRSVYQFNDLQLGFQPGKSTELGIVRVTEAIRQGKQYVAILDLKAAYDTVPRDKLIKIVQDRLPGNLAKMIGYMLQPNIFETVGDPTGTTAMGDRGVPQGSPLSPALYNVFMDTFAERIVQTSPEDGRPGNLFADDVILTSATHPGLQALLDTAGNWASDMDMTWSVKKCHILDGPQLQDQAPLRLAGEILQKSTREQYLGISLTVRGVDSTATLERVQKANKRLSMINRLGVNRSGFSLKTNIDIFRTFIRSMIEYGLHLTPCTTAVEKAVNSLYQHFFRLIAGDFRGPQIDRLLALCKLEPLRHRRRILSDRLEERLKTQLELATLEHNEQKIRSAKEDVLALQNHLRTVGRDNPTDRTSMHNRWRASENSRVRSIPIPKGNRPAPVIYMTDRGCRALAIRWYFHRFPRDVNTVREIMGEAGGVALQDLNVMLQKEKWRTEDENRVCNAIQAITDAVS